MIKGEDIITKYGNAKLNGDGYYIITSRKKYLLRNNKYFAFFVKFLFLKILCLETMWI